MPAMTDGRQGTVDRVDGDALAQGQDQAGGATDQVDQGLKVVLLALELGELSLQVDEVFVENGAINVVIGDHTVPVNQVIGVRAAA